MRNGNWHTQNDKYKILGEIMNRNSNVSYQINNIKGKVEASYQILF